MRMSCAVMTVVELGADTDDSTKREAETTCSSYTPSARWVPRSSPTRSVVVGRGAAPPSSAGSVAPVAGSAGSVTEGSPRCASRARISRMLAMNSVTSTASSGSHSR